MQAFSLFMAFSQVGEYVQPTLDKSLQVLAVWFYRHLTNGRAEYAGCVRLRF